MSLSLDNVGKYVGRQMHLADISLHFESGARIVILGRTLAGKTSLLRIMAGLDRPSSGKIIVNGKDVTRVSVMKRNIAMVYQQFINYPSLTVYANIASPLKFTRLSKSEIDRRVRDTAAILHIEHLLDRLPAELSGGQQQRTAIARALVKETELLLLDEPLVNLDYKLREELRVELQEIFEQRSAIVVYTTTEPAEALMLGGQVVVLDEGRVLQTGPTPEVYRRPDSMRVAEIISDPPINFIPGSVADERIQLGDALQLPLNGHMSRLDQGNYTFGIRCNHLFLAPRSENDLKITATVELSEINGSETFIHLQHGDHRLVVQDVGVHQLKIGRDIDVYVNPCQFFVYDGTGRLAAAPEQSCTTP